jgi:glutathione S-transferase
MSAIHLYSYQACPFARRTRMALIEKGLDFELTEIDIKNKPKDFATISPYGKVPVLLDDDKRIYESAIINEYLDEQYPDPQLMPQDPYTRAQARIWMDYCGSRFSTASWNHMQAGDDPAKIAAANTELHACLRFMETEGLRKLSDGPYWLGSHISLVDIQFMPFFQRYLDNNKADIPEDCTRIHTWLDVMQHRDSFVATARENLR